MTQKGFFKHDAESDLGSGVAYIEITDGWPTRQVAIYGESWQVADQAHPDRLADQRLDRLDLADEHVISRVEFEQIWDEAQGLDRRHTAAGDFVGSVEP